MGQVGKISPTSYAPAEWRRVCSKAPTLRTSLVWGSFLLRMTNCLPNPAIRRPGAFSEAPASESVGSGWRQLSGGFRLQGYSLEWHDFLADGDLDWSRSFHPEELGPLLPP
jgi:hypothetical protein